MDDWEQRVDAVWASVGTEGGPTDDELVSAIDALTAELDASDARGPFERGGARDSTGRTDLAVPLYREALELGLDPDRRRQAVIQLASSLRVIDEVDAAVDLLRTELDRGEEHLEPQLRAFYALALADAGREREAVGVAVGAVGHLVTRYGRSLRAYGEEMSRGEA
ncbi:hypothetical protein GCM10025865_25210 [Paraoerskovia sediminicola]|uniref:Tetratrico peptide repeat group 5 domain-containing protein n=1 Tax=Paraoerskovia sediminicola TaxID=1138587 RepID=A0ABM8G562_9CELL|nr:tetratricopeptide repeat protein [Paraoerskovia sediminicola]BDZ43222.1 hypothetical protein GCM10025865_25210 [Paraoerskovia sediminicola]